MQAARDTCRWLEAQDLGEKDLDRIVEGQPLRLKLLRRLLEAAGDPDREFWGGGGGAANPLPHVFEEQLRWFWTTIPGSRG